MAIRALRGDLRAITWMHGGVTISMEHDRRHHAPGGSAGVDAGGAPRITDKADCTSCALPTGRPEWMPTRRIHIRIRRAHHRGHRTAG